MRFFLWLFSLAIFSALLEGVFLTVVALGIYSFSHSILWALVGIFFSRMNSIIALIAYIGIEYYFNNGNLTVYSALLVGIVVIQIIFARYIAGNSSVA